MSSCLKDKLASNAELEASPELSKPKCTDFFQITRAKPWAINTGSWYTFSSEPKLCFQIRQGSSWREGYMLPIYNIWSPPYFGISLPEPNSTQDTRTIIGLGEVVLSDQSSSNIKKSYKLNCNDLIVTSYEDDAASLKARGTGSIPFERENVVGGIDVDYPSFLQCRCCLRYRGWVTLANGERWRFDEIIRSNRQSYYQFQRVGNRVAHQMVNRVAHEMVFPKIYPKTLQWECYNDWKSEYGEAPANMPFILDQDTRLCRVNPDWHGQRHWDASKLVAPVVAIMNREFLVFVNGLKEAKEIETAILRELVLMTGLTIAKFERPKLDK
ncbi:uncharacterized protein N7458_006452 [Penicillium daleae]|uniref:Uncharacterized protein n=1 Tax=Penicillium daleae TaxID=63821 RepID=A0AAD6C4C6_9EURO|nr:uncharacterized protein N7458_006452 [Penicillium daleae]KAJ5450003.1 hypothetical protein N7458_006452 [Penicillium daleae]